MVFEGEALWEHALEVARAGVDVVDAVAAGAVEVVVVRVGDLGEFVAVGLARDIDGGDVAVVFEAAEGAVNGTDTEAGDGLECGVVDLLDRERAVGGGDGDADRILLFGGSARGVGGSVCGHWSILAGFGG